MKEINYVVERGEKTCLVIIENSNDDVYIKNRIFLISVARANQTIPIYHIGLENMKKIIVLIQRKTKLSYEKLTEMLYPDKINYGKIGNAIYLITALLHADSIHRRDSDCFVNHLTPDDYPVSQEYKYMNKSVNTLNDVFRQENLQYHDTDKICIVGGDYSGNWDLDMEEISIANPDAMKALMLICGIEKDDVDSQFTEKYILDDENENKRKSILSTVFSDSQTPVCGNISMSEIYKYIPNFIGENGIGFDNHTYFMSFLVKVPIIFHFKRILHQHDAKRTENIDLYRYWHGMAKMVDYDCNHLHFIKLGFGDALCVDGFGLDALKCNCENKIPDLFERTLDSIPIHTRVNRIEVMAKDILYKTNMKKYCDIGDYLNDNKHRILNELDHDYSLSIELQRHWRQIVCAVERDAEDFVIDRL